MGAHGFNKGAPLTTLVQELASGCTHVNAMPPLVVINSKFGVEVLMGHRRLWCYKELAARREQAVKVRCYWWELSQGVPEKVKAKWLLTRTRTTDGKHVKLRGAQEFDCDR